MLLVAAFVRWSILGMRDTILLEKIAQVRVSQAKLDIKNLRLNDLIPFYLIRRNTIEQCANSSRYGDS